MYKITFHNHLILLYYRDFVGVSWYSIYGLRAVKHSGTGAVIVVKEDR